MSKKPSLHASRANKLLSVKAELAENADARGEESFRTSVILRESQKLALDEERLRIRREEGKERFRNGADARGHRRMACEEAWRPRQLRRGRRCFCRRHEALQEKAATMILACESCEEHRRHYARPPSDTAQWPYKATERDVFVHIREMTSRRSLTAIKDSAAFSISRVPFVTLVVCHRLPPGERERAGVPSRLSRLVARREALHRVDDEVPARVLKPFDARVSDGDRRGDLEHGGADGSPLPGPLRLYLVLGQEIAAALVELDFEVGCAGLCEAPKERSQAN